MNPKISDFINSIGSVAETCAIFYKSCIKQGFSAEQSLDLTKTFLHGLIMMMKSNGNEKD